MAKTEYIKREDALNAIKTAELGQEYESVELLPVISIVKCSECKHRIQEWHADKRLKNGGYYIVGCSIHDEAVIGGDDEFCNSGEEL